MDHHGAYAALAGELEKYRRMPFDQLVDRVGGAPAMTSVPVGSEVIEVEVRIRWAGPAPGDVRVEAVAYGPSCWRLERLEEAITVPVPRSAGPS